MLAFLPRTQIAFALAVAVVVGGLTPRLQADTSRPQAFARLPIAFEANQGQAGPSIKFLARGLGYTVALTSTDAILSLRNAGHEAETLRMTLVGANGTARVDGRDQLAGRNNYYAGSDPAQWHTNVPTFAKVRYESVYSGIDLVYYGNQRQLEYDFIVSPGARPRAITLAFAGARDMRIDADGSLVLTLARGELRQPAPVTYQEIGGVRKTIASRYIVKDKDQHLVAFEVGRYDTNRPLVIDPTIGYSTYLSGNYYEAAAGVTVDAAGNVYVTGFTTSQDFPATTGPCDQTFGLVFCTFVTKLDAAGAVVYSTVLAGSDGRSIAVDVAGNAYIAGGAGPMLSIVNGFQPWQAGNLDGFVARLSPTGTLVYSSFIGGGGNDIALGVATDGSGHAYAVGYHNSGNGLTTTANALLNYNPSYGCDGGGATGFLVRVDTNAVGAASLDYATNIAGTYNGTNAALGVSVDATGNAYVVGSTSSPAFPTTPGALQPTFNGTAQCWVNAHPYVVKLNTAPASCTPAWVNGTYLTCPESLVYGTHLGGSADGSAAGVAIDAAGNAFVTGGTIATDFPTTAGAPQGSNAGGQDAFVAKLNSTASALAYSTYLGGSADDYGNRVAIDASGNAFVIGKTSSTAFPTTADALQGANAGLTDAFVTRVNAAGAAIDYSSYLGGAADEEGRDIATDAAGSVYAVGQTSSSDFPTTPGALQPALGGPLDGFVTKIVFEPPTPQQEIASVVDDITALPGLTPSQVGSATAKLTAALNSLASGNTTAASNQLHALTNQIHALINSHRVTAADGQAVIDAVNGIVDQITP